MPDTPDTQLTRRPASNGRFSSHDGLSLFYRHWPAQPPGGAEADQPVRTIVLLHRGHEHSGRIAHLVDELDLPQFQFFAWDARGHGLSEGVRGDSPGFATNVRDLQTFAEHLQAAHGVQARDMALVAQSVGAVLAATWVHDYAPDIRAQVLASPAFDIKLYVPFARPGLALLQKLRGKFFVNSYVRPRFLTHDPARVASYASDPLVTRPIAVNVLLDLYATAERIVADAQAIRVPTQLLISGNDFVVRPGPQKQFFARLGTTIKEQHVLPGFYHDTLGERDRHLAVAQARRFILQAWQAPAAPSLLHADQLGPTCAEAQQLAAPLPEGSLRQRYWQFTRAAMRWGSRYSQGIRLGFETGFDSGSTLDYVYRNQADSPSRLGRLMDRSYLDSIGWKGIRARKRHAEELLHLAMQRLHEAGEPVRITDIAAGHGRYILEAITGRPAGLPLPEHILLRDWSDINVRDGQALIEAKGLAGVARFAKGDAFDRQDLARLAPRPNLAVVSGLYELFGDNRMVGDSLAGLAEAVPPGGYLVYTGQPWHPQLELIARALTSHRAGQPWVMRRRTQAEMDELVARAGFVKLTERIDAWGIFTVSLAQRRA
ncbi:hypothetical protein D8I35_13135 [Corticibacter populi]|uniref:Alpha/beta fold hydrolase n=1 Tax=Corticibacter populi TaxID=1550736 RepID=A0A3M6QQI8_9BURK|nr:bifunctional alpha/beta hydrolase/class I SAM-dependent methyltransferase [Corticibacter populi]RMX05061.1 hypothetical protein D8I35_13135 [Corticibacter populi]